MSDTHDKGALVHVSGQMHPMVAAAMAGHPDPATIEKMMDLQERWERGEARKAFTRAMVDLKRNLPAVLDRDQTVSYSTTHYTHTSLAAAVSAVTEILTDHGFTATWHPSTTDRDVVVTCRLQHVGGHCEETVMSAPPDTSGHKNPAQARMSTVTLLSRYTLLSMLGIATADMKDPSAPEPSPADAVKVNQAKNLAAASRLSNYGKTRAQAEAYLGVAVADWTAADLGKLSEWVRPPGAVAPEDEPPVREPGEEG